MTKIYKIRLYPSEFLNTVTSPTIIISSYLWKQTNTVENKKITIKVGQRQMNCMVNARETIDDLTIFCSPIVWKKLLLPQEVLCLCLRIDSTNHAWELGPSIGIVTDHRFSNHFGSIQAYLKELSIYGQQQHAFVYIFSMEGFQEDVVNGYYYSIEKDMWCPSPLPSPNIIHNRIHSRRTEKSLQGENFFHTLERANIPYFNHRYLNKWQVYQILSKHESLQPYLPETKLLHGRKTLQQMLEKHTLVFAKPVYGSQGKNIFKLEHFDDQYRLFYTTISNTIKNKHPTIPALYEVMRPRLQKQRYIIQEGIHLLTHGENRPLDFRLLCHRKNDSQWQVTSMIARVAPKDEFAANLARGGDIYNMHTLLQVHFDIKTALQIELLLKEIALEVAMMIDQHAEGIFGEFGMDLAVDQKGKPWFIEANAKPSKKFESAETTFKIRPSAKAILHFSLYLSGWNSEGGI